MINEALELARTFSTEESVKFINGMLDAIRQQAGAAKARSRTTAPSRRALSRRERSDVMSSQDEQIAQRQSNLRQLAQLGVDDLPAPLRSPPHRERAGRGARVQDATTSSKPSGLKRSRAAASWPSGRSARRTSWRSPTAAPGSRSTSGRTRCRRSTSRSSSCSTSATGSASRAGCSGPRPTSSPSGRRGCTSWRNACCRCPRSGMA